MFTNCLLPALLLLATVYYCTAYKFPLVETKKSAGNLNVVGGIVRNEIFRIKNNTCYGAVTIDDQEPLRCPPSTTKAAIKVTVLDYKPATIKITKDLNHLTVIRGKPCRGEAIVHVVVNCEKKLN